MPRPLGPNVKRLIAHKMALLAIPINTPPGMGMVLGMVALSNPTMRAAHAREATTWCLGAIDAVKAAPDNPYGEDDEQIAGVILDGIAARKVAYRG